MNQYLVFRLERYIDSLTVEPVFELLATFDTEQEANQYANKYTQELDTKTLVLNGTIYGNR